MSKEVVGRRGEGEFLRLLFGFPFDQACTQGGSDVGEGEEEACSPVGKSLVLFFDLHSIKSGFFPDSIREVPPPLARPALPPSPLGQSWVRACF